MQECWISENDDLSQIQLEGYTCISQGKRCSSSGGLIIYADSRYKYELLDISNGYTGWEGQFIKISGNGISKEIIIGNIYRPPKDLNEHYLSFINEFSQLLSRLQKTMLMLYLLETSILIFYKLMKKDSSVNSVMA